jgi:hypothetical protein
MKDNIIVQMFYFNVQKRYITVKLMKSYVSAIKRTNKFLTLLFNDSLFDDLSNYRG